MPSSHFVESLVYIVGDEFDTSHFYSSDISTITTDTNYNTTDDVPESTKYYFGLVLAIGYLTFVAGKLFVSSVFADEWLQIVISLGVFFQSIFAFLLETVQLDSLSQGVRIYNKFTLWFWLFLCCDMYC